MAGTRDEFHEQLPDVDPGRDARSGSHSLRAARRRARATPGRATSCGDCSRRRERLQIGVPPMVSTNYVNTIAPEDEPPFPGDEEMEARIRRLIRWNAAVMVLRANIESPGLGGHLSTYASAASLYEVGFNHFFRGQGPRRRRRPDLLPGPRHARDVRALVPRVPLRRGPPRQLPPGDARQDRPVVVSAPAAHAGLLGVPDGVDGARPDQRDLPGAVQPLPARARPQGHIAAARVVLHRRRRDGRAGVDGGTHARLTREARQPDLRRQLQPAASRRSGPRQRRR